MRRFATTRWSLIRAAGGDSAGVQAAYAALAGLYWDPVYSFLRRRGRSPEDAADLTQDVFASILARNDLGSLDPERGRFRSWLLAVAAHALENARDKEHAQKRNPGAPVVSLDARTAEDRYLVEPGHDLTPEKLFMRRWAQAAMGAALEQLRAECEHAGKQQRFNALRDVLLGDPPAGGYQEIGQGLGLTANAAKQEAHRLRTRFRELLRAQIADTLDDDDDAAIDAEVRSLRAALG